MNADRPATMIDVAFAVTGDPLPRDHRYALADALERALPWLADTPQAGVHGLNLVSGSGNEALVSPRTRLRLRVPCERADAACALAGAELAVAGRRLLIGPAQRRELVDHHTLYAHLVACDGDDELAFMRTVQGELDRLGVRCRPVCGLHQVVERGALPGFSLMLDGLVPDHSLTVLEAGLGAHRRLGCGLFVGHKSAAAVGAPR
ncbi:MAG TPA: type I-MYXAN CRISPR-associated protein Cas6/Cmx6 [Ramlibacter sp.]|nr:type I-MYXAN CRISPR-associated protein Cas6/Cmx6 [Ramlibacter sp.]